MEVSDLESEAIKFVQFPDAALVVATDVLNTLLDRLSYFYDVSYQNTVGVARIDCAPFHNDCESLTYINVVYEYNNLLRSAAQARLHHQRRNVIEEPAHGLPELWCLDALLHAESAYLDDLVERGFKFEEGHTKETLMIALCRELFEYVNMPSAKFRLKINQVALPFGWALRTTTREPARFSRFDSFQRVVEGLSCPLRREKQGELLAILGHSRIRRRYLCS